MKPTVPSKSQTKQGQRSRKVDAVAMMSDEDQNGKENKAVSLKGKGKASTIQKKSRAAAKKAYCVCKQPDDGTPMVHCSECKDWYHFRCVDLDERDADEISIYVCPTCATRTGRRTVMDWEGPEAIEECADAELPLAHKPTPQPTDESAGEELSEAKGESDSDDGGTEDEYIVEDKPKVKGVTTKRRTRRLSLTSESESDDEVASSRQPSANSKRETKSTAGSGTLKRKPHGTSQQPPPKRQKSSASSAAGDPTRVYCLKKLQEVFSEIFLRYPNIQSDSADGQSAPLDKKAEGFTADERAKTQENANQFANELEQCVYDIYSEPDAKGKIHAGSKYKERFRMLTFNLGKSDRIVLHKHIASSHISPKELSLMSSTDLADEETKQSIKMAEKESLEHSILQKTKAPRAKITHKGMVDIEEDDNNEGPSISELERERELEEVVEEERRERERTARLKAAQAQQRRASQSQSSVPPESPVTSHHPGGWGGPPPLPIHALQTSDMTVPLSPSLGSAGSPVDTSFPHSTPDFNMAAEPQLDLADLINIDDEPPSQEKVVSSDSSSRIVMSPPTEGSPQSVPAVLLSTSSNPPSSTGISPFAASAPKLDAPSRSSFDLNALWTAPAPSASSSPPAQDENKGGLLDADILGQGADDQDFDMFLEKDQDEQTTSVSDDVSPEAQQVTLEFLSRVWSGKISMPLDSSIPQETPVLARQVGGRQLGADSLLWRTLFPSDLLRIDGRVPVDKSAQYLLQMRMTSTKELIAVALSPASTSDESGCKTLSEYLIGKGRHGLIFPWGSRPKDHYPGRELYIIPLRATEPLPDYMELLDELRLPKKRTSDLLVGIWVLNKGKLAPPATPLVPQAPPVTALATVSASQLPVPPNTVPPATAPLQIAPGVLAAEVASLTPEQIDLMLRTLSGTNGIPPTPPTVPPQQNHLSPPHGPLSTSPPQIWQGNTAGYHGSYGSQHMQQSPPRGSYSQPQLPFNRYDQGRDDYDHSGRGWHGDNRGRSRGRGRGYGDQRKPLDSGWSSSRNRGSWDGPSRGRGGWT